MVRRDVFDAAHGGGQFRDHVPSRVPDALDNRPEAHVDARETLQALAQLRFDDGLPEGGAPREAIFERVGHDLREAAPAENV